MDLQHTPRPPTLSCRAHKSAAYHAPLLRPISSSFRSHRASHSRTIDALQNPTPVLRLVKMNPARVEQIPVFLTRFGGLSNSVNSIQLLLRFLFFCLKEEHRSGPVGACGQFVRVHDNRQVWNARSWDTQRLPPVGKNASSIPRCDCCWLKRPLVVPNNAQQCGRPQ